MRTAIALMGALACALTLAATGSAGAPSPIELRLGSAVDATVVCSSTERSAFAFHELGGRAVIEVWDGYCAAIRRDLRLKRVSAAVEQGWHVIAAASSTVACFRSLGQAAVCLAGQPVAYASAGDVVDDAMRRADVRDRAYVRRVQAAVRALIVRTS
jgi:hypothetical protein